MKLPKFKNPLQAAADFAQRMAGEGEAKPEVKEPVRMEPEPLYREPEPVYPEPASFQPPETPAFEPPPQPKKQPPRRKSTPMEDIRYTLWALCIAISVAATALTFLIGAFS